MRSRLLLSTVLGVLLLQTISGAGPPITPEDAERFQRKMHNILHVAYTKEPGAAPHHTPVTEDEVNAYLRFETGAHLPAGVTEPAVAILGGGRVEGRAVVDLEAISRQRREGETLDPLRYLAGRVPVTVSGVLRTADGVGRFELETASLAGIPVPRSLLQEVVTYFSRSPHLPEGVRLDDEFLLPARIQEIRLVARGRALVVQ